MRFLLPLYLALFSLTCSPGTDNPVDPAARSGIDSSSLDSLRLWDWPEELSPQWEVVTVSPLSTREVSDSRYTGFLSLVPGPAEAQYVHWYTWTRGDTLRIDFKVRVRCGRTTIPNFEELRILFAMTPELPTPLDVTVTAPGTTKQYLVARGYRSLIRDPESATPNEGPLVLLEYGRWVIVPTLTQCEGDSVNVRLEIANFLNENRTPPRPFWIWVELRNRDAMETVVGKIAVGVSVRERFE